MSILILTMLTMTLGTSQVADPALPKALDLEGLRAIATQHDGRWPPLDTVARDLVESVTGDMHFGGQDPVLTLLAWTFDGPTWMRQPLIKIKNAELRRELDLAGDQTVFSFVELASHPRLLELLEEMRHLPEGAKMNPLHSKVSDINGRLGTLQNVFEGSVIRLIPNASDIGGPWRAVPEPKASVDASIMPVQDAWRSVRAAFGADDASAFAAATDRLRSSLAALPAATRPSESRIATELRYNRTEPFTLAWQIMVAGALLSALAMFVKRRWFDVLVALGLVLGFATVTYGLSLRWTIAGRIPASNMYESLLFLGWGMGLFAILSMFLVRHRLVPLTASGMGAIALMLADILPMNHFVRPIAPVLLDTVWMSIHVPVIMVSYSVLALGVLVAHVQLAAMAVVPRGHKILHMLDGLHYWYIHVGSILLLAGIVTGSMWAASSWGRYWGWDPKEVWSLVALLGYLTILHVRISHEQVPRWAYAVGGLMIVGLFVLVVPMLAPLSFGKVLALAGTLLAMVLLIFCSGAFATAIKSILCFWLIVMTYVGVNYVLGIGLHSYGFGTGAVARYMFLTGGTDLAIVAVLCVIYVVRQWMWSRGPGLSDVPPTKVFRHA